METSKSIFIINGEIYFIPKDRVIFTCGCKKKAKTVKVRYTAARLFFFLAENANEEFISKDEILYSVWDCYGLSSSDQALRRSIKKISSILDELGQRNEIVIIDKEKGIKLVNVKKMYPCYYCEIKKRRIKKGTT